MTGVDFLGIDPGNKGGLARLSESSGLWIEPMPESPEKLAELLRDWAPEIRVAYVEELNAFHGAGIGSARALGRSLGVIHGTLAAFKIKTVFIRPQKWMSAIHFTTAQDTKERSRAAFKKLFPAVNALATARSRVEHEGMIEASLIAEYGRRVTKGIL